MDGIAGCALRSFMFFFFFLHGSRSSTEASGLSA